MLSISTEDQNIIRLDIDGEVSAEEMEIAITRLLAIAEERSRLRLLYVVGPDFSIPGIDALRVELRYMTRLWGLLRKTDRAALVCGIGWVRTAASVESALIPGLAIRNFDPGEDEAARDWLREID